MLEERLIAHSLVTTAKHKNNRTMQKILSHTLNGRVFRCAKCNKTHIEFKNLNFNFNHQEYRSFVDYILMLDGPLSEYKNRNASYTRKIVLDIGHRNFNMLLNIDELNELKRLLKGENENSATYILTETKSLSDVQFLN